MWEASAPPKTGLVTFTTLTRKLFTDAETSASVMSRTKVKQDEVSEEPSDESSGKRDKKAYDRAYHKSKYKDTSEIVILKKLRLYYLKKGTTPKPWTRLASWCEKRNLSVDDVLRDGIPTQLTGQC